jgi:hypothetical protein
MSYMIPSGIGLNSWREVIPWCLLSYTYVYTLHLTVVNEFTTQHRKREEHDESELYRYCEHISELNRINYHYFPSFLAFKSTSPRLLDNVQRRISDITAVYLNCPLRFNPSQISRSFSLKRVNQSQLSKTEACAWKVRYGDACMYDKGLEYRELRGSDSVDELKLPLDC